MKKKVIINVESVYTANAFKAGDRTYIAAGSETKPSVWLHDFAKGTQSQVAGSPGGVMSFVPLLGKPDTFYSIQGLYPGFVGQTAGVYKHKMTDEGWESVKLMDLPFAHRCDTLDRDGRNYLFAASCSAWKDEPADWSRAGEVYLIRFDEEGRELAPVCVLNDLFRNHGMLKAKVNGTETIIVSGAEGIFYVDELNEDKCTFKSLFDKEVSEFALVDLDGDGEDELVTIEPFHGTNLNFYKREAGSWVLKYNDTLSFGHGLSAGIFNGRPVVTVGNRRGPLTLCMYTPVDLMAGEFKKEILEEEAGPTQTLVFTAEGRDYILSANQLKNEVAIYSE